MLYLWQIGQLIVNEGQLTHSKLWGTGVLGNMKWIYRAFFIDEATWLRVGWR